MAAEKAKKKKKTAKNSKKAARPRRPDRGIPRPVLGRQQPGRVRQQPERDIVSIDEGLCNGCGLCIPGCPEGALQVIDGKARLVSDLFCDGLGACIKECPQGAIAIGRRPAEPYDEGRVMQNIVKAGRNTVIAHLRHLHEHGETGYLKEALGFLKKKSITVKESEYAPEQQPMQCGCPGSRARDFSAEDKEPGKVAQTPSMLGQWPVQLHLVSPESSYFRGADVMLAADCTAFSFGSFHEDFIRGKAIAIACPKLDTGQDVYVEKLAGMIDDAKIRSLSVVIMEVPCCSGLYMLAQEAASRAKRKIPLNKTVISIRGEVQG